MKFHLPGIFSFKYRHSSKNSIAHLTQEARDVEIKEHREYDQKGIKGFIISTSENEEIFISLSSKQAPKEFECVISVDPTVAPDFNEVAALKDRESKYWSRHPVFKTNAEQSQLQKQKSEVPKSWLGKFKFKAELKDDKGKIIQTGLRAPQLGALYALLAHWTISKETATLVLPTGVGKTETMLSALLAHQCDGVLVVVPTHALREQIANKFIDLGLLKMLGLASKDTHHPLVGIVEHRFKDADEAHDFFTCCNVAVATMSILGQLDDPVQTAIADSCNYLFIDEAHHTEAPTWKSFKKKFHKSPIVQFTATPFRNDGKTLDGKTLFEYTLQQAQADGYYKTIDFCEVHEWLPDKKDETIANEAIEILKTDYLKQKLDHILMARTLSISRAEEVYKIYKEHPDSAQFNPVRIHTGLNMGERRAIKRQILSGNTRIIVCVDMLGEGFDLPQLKIAAFHDIRQSLPITIQIVGRFTRAYPGLGNAKIVANTADVSVSKELADLYSYGADWNSILADKNNRRIGASKELNDFVKDFTDAHKAIMPQVLKPAMSTVIYKTKADDWKLEGFEKGISNISQYEEVHTSVNRDKGRRMLIIILGKKEHLIWTQSKDIYNWKWEMVIVYWNSKKQLLYVNTTFDTTYHVNLVKHLVGKVELIKGADVFKCLYGVGRVVFKNVGLREEFGRLVNFIMRFGSDVEQGMSTAQQKHTTKAVLSGIGYQDSERISIGCSVKGRIWYQRRNNIKALVNWCDAMGKRITDKRLNPHDILKNTLKTSIIGKRPVGVPITVDWPDSFYELVHDGFAILQGGKEHYLFECSIDITSRSETGDLTFHIEHEEDKYFFKFRIETLKSGLIEFEVVEISTQSPKIKIGSKEHLLSEYLTENPPTIWFADGSSLNGNIYVQLPKNPQAYPLENIITWDWSDVNIKKESQGLGKSAESIQRKVIEYLLPEEYDVVFDDDSSGEIADVVTIQSTEKSIQIELYHCKFSHGEKAGGRISDLYEVCGQAQKCIQWMEQPDEIIKHLIRREEKRKVQKRPSRIEKGSRKDLQNLLIASHSKPIKLSKVFVVQPGVSKKKISRSQLELLAVTENYLKETRNVDFEVIFSG